MKPSPLFVAEVSMSILIRDPRFWLALLLLVKSVLFYLLPTFPEQLWTAIRHVRRGDPGGFGGKQRGAALDGHRRRPPVGVTAPWRHAWAGWFLLY